MNVKLQIASKSRKIEKRNSQFEQVEEYDGLDQSKRRKLTDSAVAGELVKEIEGSNIQSLIEKQIEEPLVIPLININKYHVIEKATQEDRQLVASLDEEAVAAIVSEAAGEQIQKEIAPILQQNQVPGLDKFDNEDDKFKHDVSLRPNEASLEDYEKVPIEQFGMAMLRGMGWIETKVVGKNQKKKLVEPIVHKARPHLLGLGAEPAPISKAPAKKYIKPRQKRESSTNGTTTHTSAKNNESHRNSQDNSLSKERRRTQSPPVRVEEVIEFKIGTLVKIVDGKHTGKEGHINDIKVRDSGTVLKVKCECYDEPVRVWKEDVVLMKKEYSLGSDKGDADFKRLKKESWLRPNLKVKIISKSFESGRFYKSKCVVYDMLSPYKAILKTEDGKIIEDVHQDVLETIIPSIDDHVMIVRSKHKQLVGQTAKILEKSKSKEMVVVQMENDFSVQM